MSPKTYKICPGDTLITIAKREYGDSTLYQHIARYNRLPNPSNVRLGTVISLPPKMDLVNTSKFAPSTNDQLSKGPASHASYTMIIGINPSTTTKLGAVSTADNPGHTIVAFKDASGKLVKVFSYGPVGLGPLEAISCSAPGRTGYHLVANDEYKLYEWPITIQQYTLASLKMAEIESKPGTFSATHQCTTTSLEVAIAAGIKPPNGKGDIFVPLCGVTKGVSAPVFLDKELEKRFQAEKKLVKRVKGSHFTGLVEVKNK